MKNLNKYTNESLLNFHSFEEYTNTSCKLPEEHVSESMDYLLWKDQLEADKSLLKLGSYDNHTSASSKLPEGVLSESMDFLLWKDQLEADVSLLELGSYDNHLNFSLNRVEELYNNNTVNEEQMDTVFEVNYHYYNGVA